MKYIFRVFIVLIVGFGFSQTSVVYFESFLTGLSKPVAFAHAGDSRVFIVEQHTGNINVYSEDGTSQGTFLSMAGKISTGGEQGLLGLAFHPNYKSNGYFYINYTTTTGTSRVCRFQVSPTDSNMANAATETLILQQSQPYSNHNGGSIAFGPDGYLYIGLGDGGSSGDPMGNSQDGTSLLGKMLRIDIDGAFPYAIPASNPFVNDGNIRNEIWSLGLRNPWKYSFDRETGDLWIADVGQNAWEEIDLQLASSTGGENYGWNCFEGNNEYQTTGCGIASLYDSAYYEYERANGNCSVTGGYVYRGGMFSDIEGHYFFSDYCSGELWSIVRDGIGGFEVVTHDAVGGNVVSFGEDNTGQLYVLDAGGNVKKIVTPNIVNGQEELVNSIGLKVFPNPASDEFTFQTDQVMSGTVQVLNAKGDIISSITLDGNSIRIKSPEMSGLYLIQLTTAHGFYQTKLMVD